MLHILQVFQKYVAIVSYGCCKSRSVMLHILQVFQRHVACVSEVLFKMFHLFQTYVASVLIWMLHMFHTYVVRICSKCFIHFIWMLHLNVLYCTCFILFGESMSAGVMVT
jgi:hypothetical protein